MNRITDANTEAAATAPPATTTSAVATVAVRFDVSREARQYVDRLLGNGHAVPVDEGYDTYVQELPEWYDDVKFKRAQRYFSDNIFAMITGKLVGLVSVLSIPTIIRVLMTANGSTSPVKAYRRYMQTIFHMFSWYTEDLRPGTRSWASLEAVRKRHVAVTQHSEKQQAGIISQKDMALTQFAFFGFTLMRPHLVGLRVAADDYEAFVHFWRVLGHMQGIRDEYNLCTDSWTTTQPRLQLVLDEVFRTNLERTSDDFGRMSRLLLDGFWCLNPLLHYGSFMYFVRLMSGCKGYVYADTDLAMLAVGGGAAEASKQVAEVRRSIGLLGRANLWLHMTLHGSWMRCGAVRTYMNWHLRTAVWFIQNIPLLAIWKFGPKRAYVRIGGGEKKTN